VKKPHEEADLRFSAEPVREAKSGATPILIPLPAVSVSGAAHAACARSLFSDRPNNYGKRMLGRV